jgi:hypothetical protein
VAAIIDSGLVRRLRAGHFRILLVLRRHGAPWVPVLQDIPEVAELAGVDERRARRVLDDLETWGLVRRTRTGVGHDDRVSLVFTVPKVLNPETVRTTRPRSQKRFHMPARGPRTRDSAPLPCLERLGRLRYS